MSDPLKGASLALALASLLAVPVVPDRLGPVQVGRKSTSGRTHIPYPNPKAEKRKQAAVAAMQAKKRRKRSASKSKELTP